MARSIEPADFGSLKRLDPDILVSISCTRRSTSPRVARRSALEEEGADEGEVEVADTDDGSKVLPPIPRSSVSSEAPSSLSSSLSTRAPYISYATT
eukprot:CAMPEP_0184499738 /NCGR_PEP_ID=MMETSP0113_2-20130426/42357_1 /TAXON_ID=91329 /ORGANISM="Norrisiella sphaerica, Strain BC52" /LENGTH=95 /DNA_ID=CAMNT_0026887763 /DNA_START=56 /DNA_END=340 /DNA_ORIENTATION=-